MESLDLSDNRLTGEIPTWEGDFYSLRRVDLSGNQLSGEIPSWLSGSGEPSVVAGSRWEPADRGDTDLDWAVSYCTWRDWILGDNRLTGKIPA